MQRTTTPSPTIDFSIASCLFSRSLSRGAFASDARPPPTLTPLLCAAGDCGVPCLDGGDGNSTAGKRWCDEGGLGHGDGRRRIALGDPMAHTDRGASLVPGLSAEAELCWEYGNRGGG